MAEAAQRSEGGSAATQRFFQLVPPNPGIDFVRFAVPAMIVSLVLIGVGVGSIFVRGGLNYGIDFAGGTMVHVRFPEATPITSVREALDRPDLRTAVVQDLGDREFQIRVLGGDDADASAGATAARAGLQDRFGEGSYDVLRVESVGPKVGRDLWRDASLAVLAATLMMGTYLAFRFDLRFGIGAAVALVHDVALTLGAISLANVEFDLTTVAALLTVVGFSVNDTVIISDRIRENLRRMRREGLDTVVNVSVNETLSRTIITSGTSILVTLVLFVLGGTVIHSFAFTLLVGFVVGTYSSIFVASPVVLFLERRRHRGR